MKQSLDRIRAKLESSAWLRLLVSFALSLILYGVLWLLVRPVFATIDDARLLYVYAGYASGTPEGVYLFSNSLWGCLLSTLYSVAPAVPWYALYHFSSILILSTVLVYCLLSWGIGDAKLFLAAVLLYMAFFFSSFVVPSTLLHFETAACMYGVAGNILFFLTNFRQRSKWVPLRIGAALALLLLCYLQEKNTFYVEACLFVAVVLFKLLSAWLGEPKGESRRAAFRYAATCSAAAGAVLVLGVTLSSVANDEMHDDASWQAYEEYNPYRVAFWDYPHATYADDPELFESLGWDERFYELVTAKMYFMDERFSVDALSQIVEPFNRGFPAVTRESLSSARQTVKTLFDAEPTVAAQVLFVAFILLYLIALTLMRRRTASSVQKLCALFFGCWTLLALFLIAYLALRGRLPLRAWEVVAIPTVSLGIVVLTVFWGAAGIQAEKRTCSRKALPALAVTAAVCAAVSMAIFGSDFGNYKSDIVWRHNLNESVEEVEEYAASHPNDVFITDINYQNYNPFSQKRVKPTNVITWGSSYLFTPVYYEQLKANGLDSLLSPDFSHGGVYYVSNMERIDTCTQLLNMLKTNYLICSFEEVARVNERFSVLKAAPFPAGGDGLRSVLRQLYAYEDGSPLIGVSEYEGSELSLSQEGLSCDIGGKTFYQTYLGTVLPADSAAPPEEESAQEKGLRVDE